MDYSQDLLEFDSEVNRIPVLPSPDIPKEPLEDGLNTPPVTPLQFPHAFVKEERWLFSLPPILPVIPPHSEVKSPPNVLDTAEIGLNPTPMPQCERRNQQHLEKEQPTLYPLLTIRRTPAKKKD